MAISDAEIAIKVAIETTGSGITVRPIGTRDLQTGIRPELLSEIRVRYVAAADGPTAARPPKRPPAEVIRELAQRDDVVRLAKIVGQLEFEASFVPAQRRWLVVARDAAGRLVREALLGDDDDR